MKALLKSALLFTMLGGCGGGGVNVLNGLITTEISTDLAEPADTSALTAPATAYDILSDSGLALSPLWQKATGYDLSAVTDAQMKVAAIEYRFADICDQPAVAEFRLKRLRGPFSIELVSGKITPAILPVRAEMDYSLCAVAFLPQPPERRPHGGMGGMPPPANLFFFGKLTDGSNFAVRLPAPPRLEFPGDSILIDSEKITIDLQLPVQNWLTQISAILEGRPPLRPDPHQPLRIDEDAQPELTSEISGSLSGQGKMRRRQ